MGRKPSNAPGAPGGPVTWNSGHKDGAGTPAGETGPVWFTLGRGVIEEVFFPRPDRPCVHDLGLAVADGESFFSWEKDDTGSRVTAPEPGVPAYHVANTCRRDRYRVEKEVVVHPDWPAIVQRTRFTPTDNAGDLALYALLNPHLGDKATAWLGDHLGVPMLFAAGGGAAVALAASVPWAKRSAGFVGTSDGWHDLSKHRKMTWEYDRAEGGNVTLTGQLEYPADGGDFLLVLGFGLDAHEAGLTARAALLDGFDNTRDRYTAGWKEKQAHVLALDGKTDRTAAVYRASTAVLRTHEAKQPPGAGVASLTIPFGQVTTGSEVGGYHMVWPRDLVETAGGLLAAGDHDRTRATLLFLEATQEADGHWPQNMYVSGEPHWNGVQMDETALSVLLFDLARREGTVKKAETVRFWPMVRRAAGYLARNGPATPEDRWERDGGYSTYTLAAEIAALLAAADLATENGEPDLARYLRETADGWNAAIERWDLRHRDRPGQKGRGRGVLHPPREAGRRVRATARGRGHAGGGRAGRGQPGRPGPGPVRAAGGRRPEDRQHREGDRRRGEGRSRVRPGVAAVQRRLVRGTGRRRAVPGGREGDRAGVAVARRRARALRVGRRPAEGCRTDAPADGGCRDRHRADTRTGVGRRRHPR